jgi:dienelactone hydrolase
MHKITFESDGYALSGHMFVPEHYPKPGAFLFIQGWTGRQNLIAAGATAELGYTTMTYDMRGNGDSEGNLEEFSRADFVHDATVAYDILRRQVGNKAWIGVVGSSFGGYTAAMLSAERDVHCIAMRVPANYPDEQYDEPQAAQMTTAMREWRSQPCDYTESRALAAIHNFSGELLIVEAGADDIVHAQTPRNYADALGDESRLTYKIMENAPHGLDTDELNREYTSILTSWIKHAL